MAAPVDIASPPVRWARCTDDDYDRALGELAVLQGMRNDIDRHVVDAIAALDVGEGWAGPGVNTLEHFLRWRLGQSDANARALAAVVRRREEFPLCRAQFESGELSLDQFAVLASGAQAGSDRHYAQFASAMTVRQLRRAVRLGRDDADHDPNDPDQRSLRRVAHDDVVQWDLRLPEAESAVFDAAVQSHLDALIAAWHRAADDVADELRPPFPTRVDAFMALVEAGWDVDVARRPHGQRTTVVVHVDADTLAHGDPQATLHLGPTLTEADRQYLLCDATVQTWFERNGVPFGCGRTTRTVPRRMRLALERRDHHCVVPGCATTAGLHAHHIVHWEHGGATELDNLVLVCPAHHRMHHRGQIVIGGRGASPLVTAPDGDPLPRQRLTQPPDHDAVGERRNATARYRGPDGERVDWHWYVPYEPRPPAPN